MRWIIVVESDGMIAFGPKSGQTYASLRSAEDDATVLIASNDFQDVHVLPLAGVRES